MSLQRLPEPGADPLFSWGMSPDFASLLGFQATRDPKAKPGDDAVASLKSVMERAAVLCDDEDDEERNMREVLAQREASDANRLLLGSCTVEGESISDHFERHEDRYTREENKRFSYLSIR
jgi:hypothetical protein